MKAAVRAAKKTRFRFVFSERGVRHHGCSDFIINAPLPGKTRHVGWRIKAELIDCH
jgi:hypothetical protein